MPAGYSSQSSSQYPHTPFAPKLEPSRATHAYQATTRSGGCARPTDCVLFMSSCSSSLARHLTTQLDMLRYAAGADSQVISS